MESQLRSAPSIRPIAVVDGDPAVRGSLQFSLEIEGYVVRIFGDGAALLSDPALGDYGCMVIDHHLPAGDGLELVAHLRGRSITTPVILIASQPNSALRERASAAGVSIVEKPLLGNALASRIQSLFQP